MATPFERRAQWLTKPQPDFTDYALQRSHIYVMLLGTTKIEFFIKTKKKLSQA